jgi:ankyrin repeat protein
MPEQKQLSNTDWWKGNLLIWSIIFSTGVSNHCGSAVGKALVSCREREVDKFGDADAFYNLALAHEALQQWDQAAEAWEQAKYLNPNDEDIQQGSRECAARNTNNGHNSFSGDLLDLFEEHGPTVISDMRKIISQGVDVDARNRDGVPMLILAVRLGILLEEGAQDANYILEELLGKNVDISQVTSSGANAVMVSTLWGNYRALKSLLVSSPVDVLIAQDSVGNSVLHYSFTNAVHSITRALLNRPEDNPQAAGMSLHQLLFNTVGVTSTCVDGLPEIDMGYEGFPASTIANVLSDCGFYYDRANLILAQAERTLPDRQRITDFVNLQDTQGSTALHLAVLAQDPRSVKLLVEKGADVDLEDRYGVSALGMATLQGFTRCVEAMTGGEAPSVERDSRLASDALAEKAADADSEGGGWGGGVTGNAEYDSLRCDFQRVAAEDLDEAGFVKNYVARNTPVVVTGFAEDNWQAWRTWTRAAFGERWGDRSVVLGDIPYPDTFPSPNRTSVKDWTLAEYMDWMGTPVPQSSEDPADDDSAYAAPATPDKYLFGVIEQESQSQNQPSSGSGAGSGASSGGGAAQEMQMGAEGSVKAALRSEIGRGFFELTTPSSFQFYLVMISMVS